MEWFDFMILGTIVATTLHYGSLYHAPNSRDVVNARFRSMSGGCYRLEPVRVDCMSLQ